MTVCDVLRDLWRSPRELLVGRWNWKSALFSSVIRATIFFCCNLKAGFGAATGAMLAEFAYRSVVAGFCGALTQSFRKARPIWAANLAVIVLLPLFSHSIELLVHLLRHTPQLKTSIIASVCFTILSTLFNLYAMRRGALIVGEEACSAANDMRRIPALIAGFVACGPIALYRVCNRTVMRNPGQVRGAISTLIVLALATSALRAQQTGNPGQDVLRQSTRRYNATAYISLLSINIFNRSGVGGGFASISERNEADRRRVTLQFLSGSVPERTRGLNRLGYIQEEVEEQNHTLAQVRYFGFITANKEESLAQAKAALNQDGQAETAAYVAAMGVSSRTSARYSVRNLLLPARYRWQNADELLRVAGSSFLEAHQTRGQSTSATTATDTFLDALVRAIRAGSPRDETTIIHNGRRFLLRTEIDPDGKTGEELARRGLLAAADCRRLKGSLQAEGAREETSFRLWYDRSAGNPLPVRFEFRPRSFLRLVFDAVPADAPINAPRRSDRETNAEIAPPIPLKMGFVR